MVFKLPELLEMILCRRKICRCAGKRGQGRREGKREKEMRGEDGNTYTEAHRLL